MEREYSILELMGKEDIELHSKAIPLRRTAGEAFANMRKHALKDGIDLKIVSGFRDFTRQELIWERKYRRYTEAQGMKPIDAIDKIIEYSTIPGTSRHHWGTDVDIVDGYRKANGDLLVPGKFGADGPFYEMKKWMDQHAGQYGYYLVYTDDPKRKGFKYEPWHYSYAPVSIPMLTAFRGKNILGIMKHEEFLGSEHFTTGFVTSYIQDHILGINRVLL